MCNDEIERYIYHVYKCVLFSFDYVTVIGDSLVEINREKICL